MKKKLLVVAVMLVLSAVLLLSAQAGFRGQGQGRGRQIQGMIASPNFIPVRLLLKAKDKIGLSAEQEKKLIAMMDNHEQWAIKFRADMEIQALKLRSSLEAEQVNLKDAEGLIRAQADMRAEMQIARLHFQLDVKAVLTAEQLEKLAELKKEFRANVRDGMRQRAERRQERMN
jgi:Spy/CpxP family protein refolding chaperone